MPTFRQPLPRDHAGKYPKYAWPGGYPVYYLLDDGAELCADCANGENGSEASETADDRQWRLVAADVHWEGEPLICAHCHAEIPSAYGEPDTLVESTPPPCPFHQTKQPHCGWCYPRKGGK